MFCRKEQLIKKTGEDGVGRYQFLKQLIHEFTTTASFEAKKQTLANLANFAYDPINYDYMKQLHLTELFLAQLSEGSEEFTHFALAGLCNIACDPESQKNIISLNGITLISKFLLHKHEEISLNALTILFYLFNSGLPIPQHIKEKVLQYEASLNPRLINLGQIFQQTYFLTKEVEK